MNPDNADKEILMRAKLFVSGLGSIKPLWL
jgi:hypothetical protein